MREFRRSAGCRRRSRTPSARMFTTRGRAKSWRPTFACTTTCRSWPATGTSCKPRPTTRGPRSCRCRTTWVALYLVDACCKPGEDYELLKNMYSQLLSQRTRELMHVTGMIGGYEQINLYFGDADRVYH